MSLVGSLEDLGLGDILQIVSLSRKSGLLLLRSDSGEGRIVLCDGMVRGASIKGGFENLRGLLVGGGFLSGDDFDRARASAEERDVELAAVLPELSALTEERLESLRREHVERSVMRMFSWRTGEFSFEVKDAVDPQDTELLLPTGINTQYLAMQAIRLRDESSRDLESDDAIGDPVGTNETAPVVGAAFCTRDFVHAATSHRRASAAISRLIVNFSTTIVSGSVRPVMPSRLTRRAR